MKTDLAQFIGESLLVDTHEHLSGEEDWAGGAPDILSDLFANYVSGDLKAAGASEERLKAVKGKNDLSLEERFEGIRPAWESIQHTGYGEAVRLIAENFYGIGELTLENIQAAQDKARQWRQPGERLRLLRDIARLDHVQTDNFCFACPPDEAGPEFFLYDLSWWKLSCGKLEPETLYEQTGVSVHNLPTLLTAIEAAFARYADTAIAVKTQHAYMRTLLWQERSGDEAEHALNVVLARGESAPEEYRLCLGDWCLARGVEQAIGHNLPVKIHTGYYAGNDRMPVDRIKSGNLCALLARYPEARFVLMHIAYPYSNELVALAKHYCNVWVDLCWAWSIDPYSACDFVRRFIHAAPANKLFAFGGDTTNPTGSAAYSFQARRWLLRALQAEVDEGCLKEKEAVALAARFMRENQYACFDLEGTRSAIEAKLTDAQAT